MFLSYYSYDVLNQHYAKLIEVSKPLIELIEYLRASYSVGLVSESDYAAYIDEFESLNYHLSDFRSRNATTNNSFVYLTSLFVEYSSKENSESFSREELNSIYRITSQIIKMKATMDVGIADKVRDEMEQLKSLQKNQLETHTAITFSQHAKFYIDHFPLLLESFKHLTSTSRALHLEQLYQRQSQQINDNRKGEYFYFTLIIIYLMVTAGAYIYQLLHKSRYQALSQTDKLTQFGNRYAYDDFLIKALKNFTINQKPSHLLVLDIDKFKPINDTYGHKVGDDVLRQAAHLINDNIRERDVLFRYGGEEFTIVSTDIKTIEDLSERIRAAIDSFEFDVIGHMTISIGVTDFRLDDTPNSIFERADACLYNAKENCRNRVEFDLLKNYEYIDTKISAIN